MPFMITEEQKELDCKEQSKVKYDIFEEIDIWRWNIFKKMAKTYPTLERYFNLMEDIFENGMISEKDLDRFYKTKTSKEKSIEIIKNGLVSKLISNSQGCKLKKRITNSEKIKSTYIREDNFNFFSGEYCEKVEKLTFVALTRAQMEKNIAKQKIARLMTLRNNSNIIVRCLSNQKDSEEYSRDAFLNLMYYTARAVERVLTCSTASEKNKNFYRESYEIANQCENARSLSTQKTEKSVLDEARIISKVYGQYAVSLNQSISKTFDCVDRDRLLVESNTKIVKVSSENPVSGFVSIRNTREKNSNSALTDSEVESVVRDFSETNKFFETLKALTRIEEDKVNSVSKPIIKLVSGEEIVTMYNVSSYKDNETLYNCQSTRARAGKKEGTLFNSCMRSASTKPRIKFYAENDNFVKLLTLTTGDGKYLLARAVVWFEESTGKHYVDRIFSNCDASAEKLITHINNTENFFIVNTSGVSSGLLKDGKKLEKFLIEFNGVKSISENTPYFDTMRSNVYAKNGKMYIGHWNEIGHANITDQKPGIVYAIDRAFCDIPLVIKNDLSGRSKKCCSLCGKVINGDAVKVGENYICKKHITMASDGEILAENGKNVHTLGENKAQKSYISNAISMSEIRHFSPSNVDKVRKRQRVFTGHGICTSLIDSIKREATRYYSGYRVDITATPAKLEKKEEVKSILFEDRNEFDGLPDLTDIFDTRDGDFIYYDKTTIKMVDTGDFFLAVPIKMDEKQKELAKDLMKTIAILKAGQQEYSISEDKKQFIKELAELSFPGRATDEEKDNELSRKLKIGSKVSFSTELNRNRIITVEIEGIVSKVKCMPITAFENRDTQIGIKWIPLNSIEISGTGAEKIYNELISKL